MAQAMATDGQDATWRLLAAARPLLESGSPDALRALAANEHDEAALAAHRLLCDLGVDGTGLRAVRGAA
jgi:hypothetical protein